MVCIVTRRAAPCRPARLRVYTSMPMFGKTLGQYVGFLRGILILVAVVFALRLGLSLYGMSTVQTRWVSVNLALMIGLVYCAVAVHIKGFGAYKQLLGLLLVLHAMAHVLIALAIVLSIVTGVSNAFTAPEYFGGQDGRNWFHVAAHFLAGGLTGLVAWPPGALILLVTRKLKPVAG